MANHEARRICLFRTRRRLFEKLRNCEIRSLVKKVSRRRAISTVAGWRLIVVLHIISSTMHSTFILSFLLIWLNSASSEPKHSQQNPKAFQNSSNAFKLRPKVDPYRCAQSLDLFIHGGDGGPIINSSTDTQPLKFSQKLQTVLLKHEFIIGMISAVTLAKLYPQLGRNQGTLRADVWVGSFGVFIIFLLSSLATESSELRLAVSNIKLNFSIQFISFILWPFLIGKPLTHFMNQWTPHLLSKELLDGVLILTCLPCTVNMAILLTGASGGHIATALCNTVIGNLLAILLTPALLLYFFGNKIGLSFIDIFIKLSQKVLFPVALGQILRTTHFVDLFSAHKRTFSRIQHWTLNAVLWNTFCNSFSQGMSIDATQTVTLIILLSVMHLLSLKGLFELFQHSFFQLRKDQVVASMFCASHKTLAFGLPLIKTIFEGNAELASYCAPVMLIHPIQLFLGSLLAPRIRDKYVQAD